MVKSFLIIILIVLVCSPVFASDVVLSWDIPVDSRVRGYNIYYGLFDDTFLNKGIPNLPNHTVAPETTNSCLITNLEENRKYVFAATSIDGNGAESMFSEFIYYIVPSSDEWLMIKVLRVIP